MYTLLSMADPFFKPIEIFGERISVFAIMLVLGILLFAFVYFFRLRKNCIDEKTCRNYQFVWLYIISSDC